MHGTSKARSVSSTCRSLGEPWSSAVQLVQQHDVGSSRHPSEPVPAWPITSLLLRGQICAIGKNIVRLQQEVDGDLTRA